MNGSTHGAALRQQQRFLGVAERRPHLGNTLLVESGGCGPLPPGPWCCAVFITSGLNGWAPCASAMWGRQTQRSAESLRTQPRRESTQNGYPGASPRWRFWTMANPSAQLAQYAAMCVLDALCRPRPPRERGSDTVLCVNSGTADACTPRIIVRHFQIAASCETQNRPTLVAQCAAQNWHERRRSHAACKSRMAGMRSRSTSWSVRRAVNWVLTKSSWLIGVPRILIPCLEVCN